MKNVNLRGGNDLKPEKYSVTTSMQWFGDEIKTYAKVFAELKDFKSVRKYLFDTNAFNGKSESTAKDRIGKISSRAEQLGADGLALLIQADYKDSNVLVLMSYLNRYRLAYEFVFEELAHRIDQYEPTVNANEFENFYFQKQTLEPEQLKLTDATFKRIKSQVFNMLVHSGMLEVKSPGIYHLKRIVASEELKEFLHASPYEAIIK